MTGNGGVPQSRHSGASICPEGKEGGGEEQVKENHSQYLLQAEKEKGETKRFEIKTGRPVGQKRGKRSNMLSGQEKGPERCRRGRGYGISGVVRAVGGIATRRPFKSLDNNKLKRKSWKVSRVRSKLEQTG